MSVMENSEMEMMKSKEEQDVSSVSSIVVEWSKKWLAVGAKDAPESARSSVDFLVSLITSNG